MQLDVFEGPDLADVMNQIREKFGSDGMIVRAGRRATGSGDPMRVVACSSEELDRFRRSLEPDFPGRIPERPFVLAMVGPPGAGKTATIMKLALAGGGLLSGSVGIVNLDTYRAGAMAAMTRFADLAGLPLEHVYAPAEAVPAVARLRERGSETILVDCPGRPPLEDGGASSWLENLHALDADEVHLCLPAGLRMDAATYARERLSVCGPTHALLTRLDEIRVDEGVAELASAFELPTRWVTDGQELHGCISLAGPRLMKALCSGGGSSMEPRAA